MAQSGRLRVGELLEVVLCLIRSSFLALNLSMSSESLEQFLRAIWNILNLGITNFTAGEAPEGSSQFVGVTLCPNDMIGVVNLFTSTTGSAEEVVKCFLVPRRFYNLGKKVNYQSAFIFQLSPDLILYSDKQVGSMYI